MSLLQLILGGLRFENFTFVTSAYSTDTDRITIPSTAQSGDIAIWAESVDAGSPNNPVGWTDLSSKDNGDDQMGFNISYKILTGADPNTVVISDKGDTSNHQILVAIFRPNYGPLNAVTVNALTSVISTGAVGTQTLDFTSITPNPVLIAFFIGLQRGSNNVEVNFTTTPTGYTQVNGLDGSSNIVTRLYYKIFKLGDATPTTASAALGDSGQQGLASFYLTFTV